MLFQLPAFVGNIASASAGTVNQQTGTVTLAPTVHSVTVQLKHLAGQAGPAKRGRPRGAGHHISRWTCAMGDDLPDCGARPA